MHKKMFMFLKAFSNFVQVKIVKMHTKIEKIGKEKFKMSPCKKLIAENIPAAEVKAQIFVTNKKGFDCIIVKFLLVLKLKLNKQISKNKIAHKTTHIIEIKLGVPKKARTSWPEKNPAPILEVIIKQKSVIDFFTLNCIHFFILL